MNSLFRVLVFVTQIATVGLHFYGVGFGPDAHKIDCPTQYRYISYSHGGKLKRICLTARHEGAELPPYFRDNLSCVAYRSLVNLSLLHEEKKGVCEAVLDRTDGTWVGHLSISQDAYIRVNLTCVAYHQALVYLSLLRQHKKAACQAGLDLMTGAWVSHSSLSQDPYFGARGDLTCVAYQALVYLSLLYEEKKGVCQAGLDLTNATRVGYPQEYRGISKARSTEGTEQDPDLKSLLCLAFHWLKCFFLSLIHSYFYTVRSFFKPDDVSQRCNSPTEFWSLQFQSEEEGSRWKLLLFLAVGFVTCSFYMLTYRSGEEGQEIQNLYQVPEGCHTDQTEVDYGRSKLGPVSHQGVKQLQQGLPLPDNRVEEAVMHGHDQAFHRLGAYGSARGDNLQSSDIITNSTSMGLGEQTITTLAVQRESIRVSVTLKKKRALAIQPEHIIYSESTAEVGTEESSALSSKVEMNVASDRVRNMETAGGSSAEVVGRSTPAEDNGVEGYPMPATANAEVTIASTTEPQASENDSNLVPGNVSTNCPMETSGAESQASGIPQDSNLVPGNVSTNCPRTEEPKVAEKPEKVHVRPVAERYQLVKEERNQSERDMTIMIERTPEEFQEDLKQELEDYITKQNLRRFYPAGRDNQLSDSLYNLAAKTTESYRSELEKNTPVSDMPTATQTVIPSAGAGSKQDTNSASNPEPAVAKPSRYFTDLSKTALYTTVLLIDDSGSMRDEERLPKLKQALERIAGLTATLHSRNPEEWEGLSIRFLNYPRTERHRDKKIVDLDAVKTTERMKGILETALRAKGGTELGRMLLQKVLRPLVYDKIRSQQLLKPVLVSIITDGEPDPAADGESLQEVILECKQWLQRCDYGENAVVFHVTQIGNNGAASNFLDGLANDPDIGDFIYCTSEHIDDQVTRYDRNGTLRSGYNIWWLNELIVAING